MGTYYVRKAGNDSTGDGSTGNPWLTINKALTTISAAGGHTVNVGAGTYAETSGSNYLSITQTFASEVIIKPETANDAVIVTDNGSGNFCVRYLGGTRITFQDMTIQQAGANNQGTVVLTNGAIAKFVRCAITTRNWCFYTVPTGAVSLTLDTCTLGKSVGATGNIVGVYSNSGASGNTTLAMTNCTVAGEGTAGQTAAVHLAETNIAGTFSASITGGTYTNTGTYAIYGFNGDLTISEVVASAAGAPAVVFGTDGATATTTTGSISDSTISSTSSHALLIGYGAGAVIAENNTIDGGDFGVVLKMNDGATLRNSTIRNGSGATIYCKGAQNPTITGNMIINTAGALLSVGIGDSGQKSQNVTFTGNTVIGLGSASVFSWSDSAGDAGGGVCDYNTYRHFGSGFLGSVYGASSIKTLAGLRTAWADYGDGSNDSHSRIESDSGLIKKLIAD